MVDSFFVKPESNFIATLNSRNGRIIFQFLNINDLLNLSVLSRSAASIIITTESVNEQIRNDSRVASLSYFQISIGHDLKIGLFRRILHRLKTSTSGDNNC
jgi:hypothetical protein